MQELLRRFDREPGINGEVKEELLAELMGFPGTFRIYGIMQGPTIAQFFVEFLTNDTPAANSFLENVENMQNA